MDFDINMNVHINILMIPTHSKSRSPLSNPRLVQKQLLQETKCDFNCATFSFCKFYQQTHSESFFSQESKSKQGSASSKDNNNVYYTGELNPANSIEPPTRLPRRTQGFMNLSYATAIN